MGLKFLKSLHQTNGVYDDFLTMQAPINAEQKGDGTNPAIVTAYLVNDGKRYDAVFDIPLYPSGRPMPNKLSYKSITITPRGFGYDPASPITITAPVTANAIATKIYVSDNSSFGVGTVINVTNSTNQVEKMLVKDMGVDSGNNLPYITVERKFLQVSVYSFNNGDKVVADTSHIRLSLTGLDGSWTAGGAALAMSDVTADNTPIPFYIKVELVLNPPSVPSIPTQVKTDVYFEVTSKELPR